MQTDMVRLLFTYSIATAVVIGGFLILFFTRMEPDVGGQNILIGGFIGSALTFVFGQEVQTRTARQAATATYAATNGNGNGYTAQAAAATAKNTADIADSSATIAENTSPN